MAKIVKVEKKDLFSLALLSVPLSVLFINVNLVDPFNFGKLLVISVFSLSLMLCFLASTLSSKEIGKNFRELWMGLDEKLFISLFIMMTIAAIVSTDNTYRLIFGTSGRNNGLLYYASLLVICVIVLTKGNLESNRRRLANMIDLTALMFVSYCLIQYLGMDPIDWTGSQNPIVGTLGNVNFSSALLAGFSIYNLVWGFLSLATETLQRLARVVLAVLSGFLSWATDSIQGPLMIMAAIFLFALSRIHVKLKSLASRVSVWFISLGTAGFLFVSLAGFGPFGELLGQYTLRLRFTYAWIGLKSMLENFFFGLGVDSYLIAFREFRSQQFIQDYGLGVITDSAHSIPVQIGANFGAPAMIIFLLIMLRTATKSIKSLLTDDISKPDLVALNLLWLALFVQSLLSIEQIGLGVVLWVLSAVILRVSKEEKFTPEGSKNRVMQRGSKSNNFPISETFVLSFAIIFLFSFQLTREDEARKNLTALQVSTELITEDDKSFIEANYDRLSLQTLSDPILVRPVLEKLFAAGRFDELGEVSKQLVQLNPRDFYAWEHLSKYYQVIDDKELLSETLRKMVSLDPVNYQLIYRVALLDRDLGRKSEFEANLRKVIEIAPYSDEARDSQKLLLN